MVKLKTIYICSKCGARNTRWSGQCASCKEWNTLVEDVVDEKAEIKKEIKRSKALSELATLGKGEFAEMKRIKTGIGEFDRVLGGGFVHDSLVLLTGDPGVGKSTLVLQLAGEIARTKKVIYFSGEESVSQVGNRASRLFGKKLPEINFVNTSDLDEIIGITEREKPDFVVVDSINTMQMDGVNGVAGSMSQIKACAETLMQFFKKTGLPLLLIGHVTKGGEMAGPQVLAHLVDTVLYLEGERYNQLKILRGVKNRFGPTSEIGVFEMEGVGLKEVKNPSSIFLEGRVDGVDGSAVTVTLEGTRPFVAEVQALVSYTNFPYPKRVASGVDLNRLNIINAILSKHCGIKLEQMDVFINTIGGFKLNEPAVDLAVAASIISSRNKKALPSKIAFVGELGLSGELRNVPHLEKRIKELEKLGFEKLVLPKSKKLPKTKMELLEIRNIREIVKLFN